ncbi:hypothetical protein IFM61392_06891 [Aspergillus lentulus]|nr:hypothetical protein IFM61392_06891 [Aspergillus lentulus]
MLPTPTSLGLRGAGKIQSFEARIDAAEALKMAALAMKRQYDKSHQPLVSHPGDKILLRLHQGYNIPRALSPKYSDQHAGPFKVLQRVGPLAYNIDIPSTWKIHPVVSIAHLEQYPQGDDPFNRPAPDQPAPIQVEGQDEYEVERIVAKRTHVTKSGKTKTQ